MLVVNDVVMITKEFIELIGCITGVVLCIVGSVYCVVNMWMGVIGWNKENVGNVKSALLIGSDVRDVRNVRDVKDTERKKEVNDSKGVNKSKINE